MNQSVTTDFYPSNKKIPWTTREVPLRNHQDQFREDLIEILPRLRRFARSLTGSREQADDLLQTSCERALSRQSQWRPGTRLDSWLFTIMRSILYNQIRQDKIRTVKVPAEDSIDIADETGPSPERNILHNEVFRMVSALPEQQRAAILLVYVEGYKYQEAAELLGIPVGTLMSRLARARARVGKRFSEHHSAAQ